MILLVAALLQAAVGMPFESTAPPTITAHQESLWLQYLIVQTVPAETQFLNTSKRLKNSCVADLLEVCSHGGPAVAAAVAELHRGDNQFINKDARAPLRVYGTEFMLSKLLTKGNVLQTLERKPGERWFSSQSMWPMDISNGKLIVTETFDVGDLLSGRPIPPFAKNRDEEGIYEGRLREFGPRDLTPYLSQRLANDERAKRWQEFLKAS